MEEGSSVCTEIEMWMDSAQKGKKNEHVVVKLHPFSFSHSFMVVKKILSAPMVAF